MKRIRIHVLLTGMATLGLLSVPPWEGLRETTLGSVGAALAAPRPRIFTLSPNPAHPNKSVTLTGSSLLPNPRVLVAGVVVTPDTSRINKLTFRVPSGLPLAGCQAPVSIVVKTDHGVSLPTSLQIRPRDPRLTAPGGNLLSGRAILLAGSGFGSDAAFTLGPATLQARVLSSTLAVAIIPAGQPPGPAALAVTTECGRDETSVTVSAAPPQIVSLDSTTVAPSGVLLATTDVADPSLIASAQLGAMTFDPTQPDSFGTVARADPFANVVVSLRVPASMALGTYELRLLGSAGTGNAVSVDVIAPAVASPPVPQRMLMLAYAADDEEIVPRGTNPMDAGRPWKLSDQTADVAEAARWAYDLDGLGPHTPPADGCAPTLTGDIEGFELHCSPEQGCVLPDGRFPKRACRGAGDALPNLRCHPIRGTYRLSATENFAEIFIDRGSPEGPEHHVGGWGTGPGPQMAPPVGGDFYNRAYLVFRSKRTGAQLSIAHVLQDDCRPPEDP